ncbi:MAG TPA: MBL fold metallo-hydrolase [Thermodesulfobacteriota bacterium]|nr:MBL fold metallo-hydrolase [Thermodesulfobacteriota bacterium]
MTQPSWLQFFQRQFPSANMVLIRGDRPILVDTGFGSDFLLTERLLQEADVHPKRLHLVVNTHYHSDHVGGNSELLRRYGVQTATHRWEASLINNRDPEACCAKWLDQPVEPYQVTRYLSDGEEIDTGNLGFHVLHTPGHTLGHIVLYEPKEQVLLCGDAVHGNDVAWLNPFREGVGSLQRAIESLDRLARLRIRLAYSGHGPAIENPYAAIDAARYRYEKWLDDPLKAAWHACKRIFAYALILKNGLPKNEISQYLLSCPWFQDYSRHVFGFEPPDFIEPLLSEMLRSGAARYEKEKLVAQVPHNPPSASWRAGIPWPQDWPKKS